MKLTKRFLAGLMCLLMLLSVQMSGWDVFADSNDAHYTMNLEVRENIISHYVVDCQAYMAQGGVKLRYRYNRASENQKQSVEEGEVVFADLTEDSYVLTVPQAAAQIAEPTVLTVLDAEGNIVDSVTYSAKAYCDKIIGLSAEELAEYTAHGDALKQLCKAIITYGKAAQGVFGSYATTAIESDYAQDLALDEAAYTPASVKKDSASLRFTSAAYLCTAAAQMRFYYTADSEPEQAPAATVPEGASVWTGHANKNGVKRPFVQVDNIKPVDFDEQMSIAYGGADTTMSVLDYAGKVIAANVSAGDVTFAKSLIVYNREAEAYFSDHEYGDWTVSAPAVAATCTEAGVTAVETRTCAHCSKTETRGGEVIPALGHNYESVVTAPTCTEAGYTTYTCSRCGDAYTADETAVLGHNYESVVTAPTCTEGGYTTYTCSRCGDNYTETTPATGHTAGAAVEENRVEPGCETDGSYDTVVYCTVCGYELSRETTTLPATGHSWGDWTVITEPGIGQDGERQRSCVRCGSTESEVLPALTAGIEVKLPHVDSYLYRAGNANNIAMSSLFKAIDGGAAVNSAEVTVTIENVAGNANGTFTANTSDWTAGTVKLSGTGVVKLTVKQSGNAVATLYLEVVNATNATTVTSVTSTRNVVLLNDIAITGTLNVSGGTLYGNGFTIDATGTVDANGNTVFGYLGAAVNVSNGTLNNVSVIGPNFKNAAMFRDNVNNVFSVKTSGECYIYNCYIFGSRAALATYGASDTANVTVENTVFDGGRFSNIFHRFGALTLHNVTTINQPRTTLNGDLRCGFGIVISDEAMASETLKVTGYLKQYNWVGKNKDVNYFKGDNSDSTSADTAVSTLFSNMYTKASALTTTYNGDTYINTGILSLNTAAPKATGEGVSGYSTANVSLAGFNAWVMAPTSLNPAEDFSQYDETDYAPNTQTPTVPTFTWNYPSTYSATEKQVNLNCETGSTVSFNPNILTVTKWNNNLAVSVSMNGTNYTGSNITFSSAGTYTIEYTITDPYNYAADGVTASNYTYKKTLTVEVSETIASIHEPEFTFYNTSSTALATKIVDINGNHYVTVDTNATSDTVKSTTVNGTTVYFPVVDVRFKDNASDFNYLLPILFGITIKNYTDENGSSTTYSKSTNITSLPSGLERVSADPNWNGKTTFNSYARDSSYGLYAKSAAIGSNQSARTATVQFKFTAGNGETYYYYIYYSAAAHNKPTCVTDGTLVTMADGTQKPIEDVKVGDMVMTWSMWNGCYEAQPVVMHWYHGTEEWRVLTLTFSDGTEVRTINEHGFFDADKNTYAYITEGNVGDYIGDSFIKQNADGTNSEVVLTDYAVTDETVGSYSIQTAFNENFMVEGMLSMTGEDYTGRFEYFDIGEGMQYDAAKMQADIDRYGLYSYEDFAEYLTPEQFAMFNGQYFKVLVGKGVLTYEDILGIISGNL